MVETKEDEAMASYTMSRALEILHEELSMELQSHQTDIARTMGWRHCFSVFHHQQVQSLYHWPTVLISIVLAAALFVSYGFSQHRSAGDTAWLLVEGVVILLFLSLNIALALHNVRQQKMEFLRLLGDILGQLSTCMQYNVWNKSFFPHLESPYSPCLSLQWTLRAGQVYNVPVPLLVKGDIILLRPSHKAPARCKALQGGCEDSLVLNEGEIFSPEDESTDESFTVPKGREPRKCQKFLLLETPYVSVLRQIMADGNRPATVIDNEKFFILTVWIERRVIPVVMALMLLVNVLRYNYMQGHVGHWTDMVITLQVQAVIPLVPLIIPLMYLLINFYGQARVFAAFEEEKSSQPLGEDSFNTDSSISADEARIDLPWTHVLDWFKNILLGRVSVVTRKINITHVLGSVTSLCCVDKKGVISYPNPTPEKVFFLRWGRKEGAISGSNTGIHNDQGDKQKYTESAHGKSSCMEVLDVTSDPKNSFTVRFDDPGWTQHLNSLKPLGLTILANTCNLQTADWYSQFADHVACAGLQNEETVAVVNRRCLCPLAREIGFSEKALEIFTVEKTLGMFQQVSAEMTTKERVQRAKSFIRHKIPMPNMVSVILKEKFTGARQLLSQGTADILLASCTDYWDGEDLRPLTQSDRKKILDFYHRTSIGSYCTAFSYCPVRQGIVGYFDDMYIEVPDDMHNSNCHGSLSSVDQDLELLSDARGLWDFPYSFSADSLIDDSSIQSVDEGTGFQQWQRNQVFIGMITMQYQARQDFIQLIDKLEGACIRFVHFSQENEVRSRVFAEKMGLEAGWNCHISLRSEQQYLSATSAQSVNSPDSVKQDGPNKMSRFPSRLSTLNTPKEDTTAVTFHPVELQQQGRRLFSASAPSVVHLGSSQVKFETKVRTAIVSPRRVRRNLHGDDVAMAIQDGLDGLYDHEAEGVELLAPGTEELDGDYGGGCSWLSEEELSRQASSYITENTEDSLAFDNRAKLPRGIENIRPHLQSIDNVPLLVNLFTDCTTETTYEMMKILQEHGEVVLCVGSSINMHNVPLFLHADCSSLALEPLCPQVCVQQQPGQQPGTSLVWERDSPTPVQLAGSLLNIMCPIIISKGGNISLIHLIAEARSQLMSLRSCFYFLLCCSLSLTVAQLLASLLQLPTLFPPQHMLWLILIVLPLLSLTMMGNPVDARVMSIATSKNNNHIPKEMIQRFILYFLVRFLPPVLVALVCYGLTLHSFCAAQDTSTNTTLCAVFDILHKPLDPRRTWTEEFSGGLVLAQNIFTFLIVLYFEVISLSFVHWKDHLWEQFPATNKLWLLTVPLLLCGQIVFCVCDVSVRSGEVRHTMALSDVHPGVWSLGLAFPVVMVIINELVKHREVKVAVRCQKRARLDFGTKLGMNSPF
ncbi:transmembrane protein 94-like isoform X3 [Dreissena polymorpha]|uniref:transmembrane protein 94-like isoform X3 n=1 Tax=Dreissena polymorpha TaxID=45954 RepID=UPI002264DFC2|nr:transmembrane protein 94-like isoform X3 [Dreissena polymorpha]